MFNINITKHSTGIVGRPAVSYVVTGPREGWVMKNKWVQQAAGWTTEATRWKGLRHYRDGVGRAQVSSHSRVEGAASHPQ